MQATLSAVMSGCLLIKGVRWHQNKKCIDLAVVIVTTTAS